LFLPKERILPVAILYPDAGLCDLTARIQIHPKLLESLLDCLAKASFPINPELRHDTLRGVSCVDFALSEPQVAEIEDLLRASGFNASILEVRPREMRSDREERAFAAEHERDL
jgi:hypothetical protein